MNNITRPVLRYPGGKFRISKWTVAHFPPHSFYVEPYFGAGSCFFQKNKANGEIINDINKDVVNVFKVLRDPVQAAELERRIRLTPMAYDEYLEAYGPTEDPIEAARQIIFRSCATYGIDGVFRLNSGFRAKKNRESRLTTANEWANYPDQIKFFTKRLQGVIIDNRPAIDVIQQYDDAGTFTYCDPPYLMDSRARQDRALYEFEMGENEEEEEKLHRELAEVLHSLKGTAIIAGYDSPLYRELYGDWKKEVCSARAMGNSPRIECIWLSPGIQPKLF